MKNDQISGFEAIFGLIAAAGVLWWLSQPDTNKAETSAQPSIQLKYTEVDAATVCREKYIRSAPYEVDVGYGHHRSDNDSHWYVKIEGKMQNAFGAWEKRTAHCMVDKALTKPGVHDLKAISSFNIEQQK